MTWTSWCLKVAKRKHAISLVVKDIMMKENGDLKLGQITSRAYPTSCSKWKETSSSGFMILDKSWANMIINFLDLLLNSNNITSLIFFFFFDKDFFKSFNKSFDLKNTWLSTKSFNKSFDLKKFWLRSFSTKTFFQKCKIPTEGNKKRIVRY